MRINKSFAWVVASFVALLETCGVGLAQTTCTESWVPGVSQRRDPNGDVSVQATLDLGSGPELVIAGYFTRVADVPVWHLARFNGTSWTAIGTNSLTAISLQLPLAVAVFDDGTGPKLHVAGTFSVPGTAAWAHRVARWDGTAWTIIGTPNFIVLALKAFTDASGPALAAAGQFTSMNGVPAVRIARWNGTSWSQIGAGFGPPLTMATPFVLEVFDDGAGPKLYAGGVGSAFTPGTPLAQWTGTQWVSVAPPALLQVRYLCVHPTPAGNALIVAGSSQLGVGGSPVLQWSGGTWSVLASVLGGIVNCVASWDDGTGPAVYFGGTFTSVTATTAAAAIPAMRMARVKNGVVSALGGGLSGQGVLNLSALPVGSFPGLIASGSFLGTTASDPTPHFLARWTGTQWTGTTPGISPGPYTVIRALATFDDGSGPRLYAAGDFHTIGTAVANGLARWNGSSWEGLGAPLAAWNLRILDLEVFDDGSGPKLFLGTTPLSPPGVPGTNVVRWNGGASFTPVGTGLVGLVKTLAVWDDGNGPALWAGGLFTSGPPGLARWNGTGWDGLQQIAGIPGPGIAGNPTVNRLTVEPTPGGALLVGGRFTSFGPGPAGNIARLAPGYAVDSLGGGSVLAVDDVATLHDGVAHRIWALVNWAGTTALLQVLRFDAPQWSLQLSLNGGSQGVLRTVPHFGGEALYLAEQTSLPALACSVRRFDGTTWSQLGTFVGVVHDMLALDDGNGWGVFAGGNPDTINGVAAGSLGHFVSTWPVITSQPASVSVLLGQPFQLTGGGAGAPPLTLQWMKSALPIPGATSATYSVAAASLADLGTYHLVASNACGPVSSREAYVAVRGCELTISQPFGPGTIGVSHSSGLPGGHAFTAFSLNVQNGADPGGGPVFGLYLDVGEVIAQFLLQAPPFVTTLSAAGTSSWAFGPVPQPLIGATVWGVTTLYDPAALTLVGSPSNIAERTLQ